MSGPTRAAAAARSDPAQATLLSFAAAVHAFHAPGPRARFLRTLPREATVLDDGIGDGSLTILRDWPAPARPDLRLFAWAGTRGQGFDRYDAREVGFWPDHPRDFGGLRLGAVFSANFIEQIDDPPRFVAWAAGRVPAGGRLYLQ